MSKPQNLPAEREDCSELAATLAELALTHGAQDGATLDSVVKAIQADLPEFTREDIVDSVINYTRRPKSETLKQMNLDLARFKREVKYDKSLRTQIETIHDKIRNKDYEQPTRNKRTYDEKTQQLQFERDRAKRELEAKIESAAPKTIYKTFVDGPFNESRAVITAFDLSGVGRQGGFIGFASPIMAAKGIMPMLRAMRSERVAHDIDKEIRSRPNNSKYQAYKLFLPDPDGIGNVGSHEEVFATNFPIINAIERATNKIPVVRYAGKALVGGIHGSARAYITYLNKLRADKYDVLAASLSRYGTPTRQEGMALAKFINVATGRGGLGPLEKAADFLNTVFFAPRYAASRFQILTEPLKLLAGKHMYGGTRTTDKIFAKEYAKYLTGVTSLLGLIQFAGMIGVIPQPTIETDIRSTDFGKVKIGNTRVDLFSGLQQSAVFMAQELPKVGAKKSLRTGEITPLDGSKFGQDQIGNAVNFGRKKLSPMFSTGVDLYKGSSVTGQPVTLKSAATNLITPMAINDLVQSMSQDYGVPTKVAVGIADLMGASVNTFDATAIQPPSRTVTVPPSVKEDYPSLPNEIELNDAEYQKLMAAHAKGIANVMKARTKPDYAKKSQADKAKIDKDAYNDYFDGAKNDALDHATVRLTKK